MAQGLEIALAAVASACLVFGLVLMWHRSSAANEAAEAAFKAANAAQSYATALANPSITDEDRSALATIDWDKIATLLEKFPENDRGPLIFVVLGALGWLVITMIEGWVNISFGTPTPTV
jgi:hypothetical protein